MLASLNPSQFLVGQCTQQHILTRADALQRVWIPEHFPFRMFVQVTSQYVRVYSEGSATLNSIKRRKTSEKAKV